MAILFRKLGSVTALLLLSGFAFSAPVAAAEKNVLVAEVLDAPAVNPEVLAGTRGAGLDAGSAQAQKQKGDLGVTLWDEFRQPVKTNNRLNNLGSVSVTVNGVTVSTGK